MKLTSFWLAVAFCLLTFAFAFAETPAGYPAKGALAAKRSDVIVTGGPVFLQGCLILNTDAAAAHFVQFFDSATVPADATVPFIAPLNVPASGNVAWDAGAGGSRVFNSGVSWAESSTAATKTLTATSDILMSCQYNGLRP